MENKNKKYYVMDQYIKKDNEDSFGHRDLAKNIFNLITNDSYSASYNVALIGKWGLGKTSILKILENMLNEENNKVVKRKRNKFKKNIKYKMIFINAWKYEKESLNKVLLRDIYKEATGKKVFFSYQLEKDIQKKQKTLFERFLETLAYYILWSVLISVLWQFVHYCANFGGDINFNVLIKIFNEYGIIKILIKVLNFYFENILTIFGVSGMALAISIILEKKKRTDINLERQDNYESLLNIVLQKYNTKYIIVIDDLDRLSSKKQMEALDTFKILMDLKNCILIVPFDDSVLKKTIDTEIVSKYDKASQTIESEFILDKLFQFRFYVPPLIDSDKKDYILDIIKNETPDLNKIFNEDELDRLVSEVFCYDGIKTPRQIKKIINIFANNILLFKERVDNKKIEKNLFDINGKLFIAKLSVLQSDFNEFYNDLYLDNCICEQMLLFNSFPNSSDKKKEYNSIPDTIKKYFTKTGDNGFSIAKKYINLMNFLSRTANINSSAISIYLYYNQNKMSLIYGNEFNRNLTSALKNANFSEVNYLIEKEKSIKQSISIDNLLIECLETSNVYELSNIILSILNIKEFEFNNGELKKKLSFAISKVYSNGLEIFYEAIDFIQLLKLAGNSQDKSCIFLLNNYFKNIKNHITDGSINHKSIFAVAISDLSALKQVSVDCIKQYFYRLYSSNNEYIKIINDNNMDDDFLEKYFGIDLYKSLSKYLKNCCDDSLYEEYSELFKKMYSILANSENKDEINKEVIDLIDDNNNIAVCVDIINKHINLFSNAERGEILTRILEIDNKQLKFQYECINSLGLDMESDNEKFGYKIISFVREGYDITLIMDKISDYSNLSNTITLLNQELYENDSLDAVYINNLGKFSDIQLSNLVNILNSKITNSYEEGRLTKIVKIIGSRMPLDIIVSKCSNITCFKNRALTKEVINMISDNDITNMAIINNYIKEFIRYLETSTTNIEDLENISSKISPINFKNLHSMIVRKNLYIKNYQVIFNIYTNIDITDENVPYLKNGLNKLLTCENKFKVIDYMIKHNFFIENPINFIFDNMKNLNDLEKCKKLNTIIKIDDSFKKSLVEKLKNEEYNDKQLKYLISLDNTIYNYIITRFEERYVFNNKILISNIEKIMFEVEGEEKVIDFQLKILKSKDLNLIMYMLPKFEKIKKQNGRKLIKVALEDLAESYINNSRLIEEIETFYKEHNYRNVSTLKKEKVVC